MYQGHVAVQPARARGAPERIAPPATFPRSLSGELDKIGPLLPRPQAAQAVRAALAGIGMQPREMRAEAHLSAGGARMPLFVRLPRAYDFDPGDGHALALRLVCLEPEDGSARPRMMLDWYRYVSGSGFPVGTASLWSGPWFEDLAKGLELADRERVALKVWRALAVPVARFVSFADGELTAAWGVKAAARFLHIATTGFDGEVIAASAPGPAHAKELTRVRRVPGSPAHSTSAYDAAQALAWLAKERREAEERVERELEIPELMQRLLGRK